MRLVIAIHKSLTCRVQNKESPTMEIFYSNGLSPNDNIELRFIKSDAVKKKTLAECLIRKTVKI